MTLDDCRLIDLPKIKDARGNLTFLEGNKHIPFEIKRAFYVYDIPSGESRGAHAHHHLHQFIVCVSGGMRVVVDDGHAKREYTLNRPWQGLYIPPMIWAAEGDCNTGTVYVVFASDYYSPESYIRDYDTFLTLAKNRP